MIAEDLFLAYADRYDRSVGMIELKVVHTMEVAKVMDHLTECLNLDAKMKKLGHICAIFHDIGRFEQVRIYHTFLDHLSVDHADFGCEVLEKEHFLWQLGLDEAEQKMVLTAVKNHNKYAIEDGLDEKTLLLCKLIRDADKSDIFRVFACEDLVDTMGSTLEEVEEEYISDAVYQNFMEHRCIDKTIRVTGLDKWVGFLGFFYDMYFPEAIRLQRERQYYRQQFDHAHFRKESTRQQVDAVLAELEQYLDQIAEG